jgi:(2Fe-2S) ferredoxin
MTEGPDPHHRLIDERRAVLLLARSAVAAAPHDQMRHIAELAATFAGVAHASYCFSEQGTPSLRDGLKALCAQNFTSVVIVPLLIPMEPSFLTWLAKTVRRWQAEAPDAWPPIHVTGDLGHNPEFATLLAGLIAADSPPLTPAPITMPEGSIVPAQKRRVLVCEGGACHLAGADVIWGHLRNRQEERKLRVLGDGTMTAKSSCLGPCNLAPVLQVYPEGIYYGGVTEAAVDRIVEEHLLGGTVVEDFAYPPTGKKQRLRSHA